MQILNSLIPIFFVIGLGILLRRNGFLSADTTSGFNRFAYFFGLPFFLFYKIAGAATTTGLAKSYVMVLLGAAIATAFVGWLVTWWLRTPNRSRGAMVQACFRGNLAFIGLPLVLFTIDRLDESLRAEIEVAAVISLLIVATFYNVASVTVLTIYNERTDATFSWRHAAWGIVTNPLIAALVAGAVVQAFGWTVPVSINRTCRVVGASAFPMALLGIGSQLASVSVKGNLSLVVGIAAIKCIVCPLLGLAIALLLGLDANLRQPILLMCAVPTAISSFVLTDQMRGDSDLAASAVVVCTAFSFISLSAVLLLTG